MSKKKFSYIEALISAAEKHEVEEYLYYKEKGRNLTTKQLELILLSNRITVPKDLTPKLTKQDI